MMSDAETAYRTLGLEPDASLKEIREAHRDLSLVWDASRFDDNPQLKKKALDNLARIDEAYRLLIAHRGAQIPESEPVKRTARPEDSERVPSLYEEIFRGRTDKTGRRLPFGALVAVLVVMVVIVGYLILPTDEDDVPPPLSAQAEEPSALDEAVENTGAGLGDLLPDASEPEGEDLAQATGDPNPLASPPPPPADSQARLETGSQPPPESPAIADSANTEVLVAKPEERAPADKPILQREVMNSVEEPEEPAGQEVQEDEGSDEAFEILKAKSLIARQLIEAGAVPDLSYQEWETVRRNPPEFWIDVVARRSANGEELHLIWSVNTETGVVRALSQAARDLEPDPSPD